MPEFLQNNLIIFTILAGLFTFSVTTLGSSTVFLFKTLNRKILSFLLSFAAGVMMASLFFSLILPAIEMSEDFGQSVWFNVGFGCLFGVAFVVLADICFHKINKNTKHKKSLFTFLAITLHNIPEGMCIGVAFASSSLSANGIMGAVVLAIGIGVQNFPEGASVSMPLLKDGFSKKKAFLFGSLSGIVEPIFAVLAFVFVNVVKQVLPLLLSFTAGVMLAVSAIELMPEASEQSKRMAAIGLAFGFVAMALLDILL